MSEDIRLRSAVEAILFAAAEPVRLGDLAEAFEGVTEDRIREVVESLASDYDRREAGLQVEQVAGAYRLATRSATGASLRQFFRKRNRTRLSHASLETLAIVAYRQPITAPEIQAIRGVDPSGPLRSLVEKKLIRIVGRKKVVGNPLLYGTSRDFLVHFGLNSLDDLPSMEQFEALVGNLEVDSDPPREEEAEEVPAPTTTAPQAGGGDA